MPPPNTFTSDTFGARQPFTSDAFGFNDGREVGLRDYIFSRPDVETKLRNDPQAVIDAISEYNAKKGMITLGRAKIDKCNDLLSKLDPPPKTLVELGCYVGMSAIGWGDSLKKLNESTSETCKVFTTELDETIASVARDLIALAGLDDVVTVLDGPAAETIRKIKTEGQIDTVDVMFFDHWQEAYLPDLKECENLRVLRKGTLILADNTDVPGTPDFNQYLEDSNKYHVERYETEAKMAKIVLAATVIEVP
ncbi:hypothetical protein LTS17_004133 [Exophiala oligosperma]